MEKLKHIIESLLFVSEEPLNLERIKAVVGFAEIPDIRRALKALEDEYETRGGGFTLRAVAGGYQLRTRAEHKEYIKRLVRSTPPRLSRAALETLAVVAYYKPITRTDIEHIRGVDCGGVLRMLLERKLIRVLGRKEVPGRPMIYETTKRFLEVFDLRDIRDLPTINEIESLGRAAAEETALALEQGADEYARAAARRAGEEAADALATEADKEAALPPSVPDTEADPTPPEHGGASVPSAKVVDDSEDPP
jgi:segregation and condensation protein B